jgi:phosphatidylglycerophosphate synthase
MLVRSLPFERLGVLHAWLVLLGCLVLPFSLHPWPLVATGAISFGVLFAAGFGRYTLAGRFGAANVITALRLLVLFCIVLVPKGATLLPLAAAFGVAFALDGLDGWVARSRDSASEFGAHFDVEVDAWLVLVLNAELWYQREFGPWIFVSGLLRYFYVLALSAFPSHSGPAPRSLFGRLAFTGLVVGLLVALIAPSSLGEPAAFFGTALVAISFARSFRLSWGRPRLARPSPVDGRPPT